jgi:hypothetical protein
MKHTIWDYLVVVVFGIAFGWLMVVYFTGA